MPPTLGKNTSYHHKDDLSQEDLDNIGVAIDDGVDEEDVDEDEDDDDYDDVGKSAGGVGVTAAANARDDADDGDVHDDHDVRDDEEDVDNGEEENEGGVVPPPIPIPPPPPPPLPPSSSFHPPASSSSYSYSHSHSSLSSPLLPLLSSLRAGREELESAERADARSAARLAAARAAYDGCARALAGYVPLPGRRKRGIVIVGGGGGGGGGVGGGRDAADAKKRARATSAGADDAADAYDSPGGGGDGDDVALARFFASAPANELRPPRRHVSGGGMDEASVLAHRDEFSLRISGGEATSSSISSWTPPSNNANWKSRTQLDGWMDIVRHWDTGKGGMDAGAFRARHKTFYSRMKPASCNLGRRTGMHLREAIAEGGAAGGGGTGVSDPAAAAAAAAAATATTTVLCRYNKAGNRSTLYLAVDQLFDALFELHSLELSHRGRDATKTLADERYANVPDATIRAFLDTCPICSARRGGHHHHNGSSTTTNRGGGGGGGGDDHFDPTSLLGLQDSI